MNNPNLFDLNLLRSRQKKSIKSTLMRNWGGRKGKFLLDCPSQPEGVIVEVRTAFGCLDEVEPVAYIVLPKKGPESGLGPKPTLGFHPQPNSARTIFGEKEPTQADMKDPFVAVLLEGSEPRRTHPTACHLHCL